MNRAIVRKKLNSPCACKSDKKYKNCCFKKDVEKITRFMKEQVEKKQSQGAFEKKDGIWRPR